MFYFDCYQGIADTLPVKATETGTQPKDTPCKFCIISNFDVINEAETFAPDAAAAEVYFGFNGTVSGQIKPGEQSQKLYINNLKQLVIRSRPGTTRQVWITYFY